jgi:hypothetical protein
MFGAKRASGGASSRRCRTIQTSSTCSSIPPSCALTSTPPAQKGGSPSSHRTLARRPDDQDPSRRAVNLTWRYCIGLLSVMRANLAHSARARFSTRVGRLAGVTLGIGTIRKEAQRTLVQGQRNRHAVSLSSLPINGTQSTLLSRAPGCSSGNFRSTSAFI